MKSRLVEPGMGFSSLETAQAVLRSSLACVEWRPKCSKQGCCSEIFATQPLPVLSYLGYTSQRLEAKGQGI